MPVQVISNFVLFTPHYGVYAHAIWQTTLNRKGKDSVYNNVI